MTFDDPKLKNIIVIEDDQSIREVVRIVLEENGFEPFVFPGSKSFLEAIKGGLKVDLIFLDIWLTRENGKDLALKLKKNQKTKNIPLIIFTANSAIAQIADEILADGFLPKPFDIEQLLETVKKFT